MTLLRVGAVAALLGTSPSRARYLDDRGILPALPRANSDDKRQWRLEDVEAYLRNPVQRGTRRPVYMRIWSQVVQDSGGCWIFTGSLNAAGYGQIGVGGRGQALRTRGCHRVMYEEVLGAVPAGLTLDHLCRNRACCNPWHLEPVTSGENVLRGESVPARNARKTHCKWGHEFTPENTYTGYIGRSCRRCHADREAQRRERLRAASKLQVAA